MINIFGREKGKKEDKQVQEMKKFIDKYQLEDLGEKDLGVLKRNADDLVGNGFLKEITELSFGNPEEQAKVTYLSAQVEQNWMIIRQLGRLNKNIEQLLEK